MTNKSFDKMSATFSKQMPEYFRRHISMHETVLVTGVNGFLGQHIVREFVARKSRVAAVSRSPILETAPWTNSISDLLVTDLCSPQFEATLVAVKPDLIIHAAGPSSVAESVKDPTSDFLGSVDVFYHVMDSVRRLAPSCKVLLLSSAAVYGTRKRFPFMKMLRCAQFHPMVFTRRFAKFSSKSFIRFMGSAVARSGSFRPMAQG